MCVTVDGFFLIFIMAWSDGDSAEVSALTKPAQEAALGGALVSEWVEASSTMGCDTAGAAGRRR